MSTLDEYAQAGIQAIQEQRIDEAIEAFAKALEIDPDRPDMNNALGMAYMHRREVGSAVPYLEKAWELARAFADEKHAEMRQHFASGLVTAYILGDKPREALELLAENIAEWPHLLKAKLQLSQLYFQTCQMEKGLAIYQELARLEGWDPENQKAAQAVVDAAAVFKEAGHDGNLFLQAHSEGYIQYFTEIVGQQEQVGWLAEAARMKAGPDGNPIPILAEGAKTYALTRVDLVNPADGTVAGVYSEQEPMVVQVNGFEPLSQVPILMPWKGNAFETWVCTQVPWHWLTITIQFVENNEAAAEALDLTIGDWYLAGYNGEFGDKEAGRFHYVTDPEPIGETAIAYTFDLGRARYDAIPALLTRLTVLHDKHPILKLLFGHALVIDTRLG